MNQANKHRHHWRNSLLKSWQYTNCPYNHPTLLFLFQTHLHSLYTMTLAYSPYYQVQSNKLILLMILFKTIQSTTQLLNPFTVPNHFQTMSWQRQCYNPIHNTPTTIYRILPRIVTRYKYYKPDRIYPSRTKHRTTEQIDTSLLYLLNNRDYIPDKVIHCHN